MASLRRSGSMGSEASDQSGMTADSGFSDSSRQSGASAASGASAGGGGHGEKHEELIEENQSLLKGVFGGRSKRFACMFMMN
jgi:hypothetical protein